MNRLEVVFISRGVEETLRWGERLALCLRSGDVVGIDGELGSGKTVLIQGICRGLGVVDDVTSPTFTLIHEYEGRVPVYHLDFYRLDRLEEVASLGLETYFDSEGISLIEWAERGESLLPIHAIRIRIERTGGGSSERQIRLWAPEGRSFPIPWEKEDAASVSSGQRI